MAELDPKLSTQHYRRMYFYALNLDYDSAVEASQIFYGDLFRSLKTEKNPRLRKIILKEMEELLDWDQTMVRAKSVLNKLF